MMQTPPLSQYMPFNGGLYLGPVNLKGLPHGNGKFYCINLCLSYDGNYVNGKKEGEGKAYFTHDHEEAKSGKITKLDPKHILDDFTRRIPHEFGLKYVGMFYNNSYNGKGVMYNYNNTIMYQGDFKNGKYFGQGSFHDENGVMLYKGGFKNNNYEGTGEIYANNALYYQGDMKNNMMHGHGKIFYSSGVTKYCGRFKNNKCHGRGVSYEPDGVTVIYDGMWQKGLHHGDEFDKDGEIQACWKHGKLISFVL